MWLKLQENIEPPNYFNSRITDRTQRKGNDWKAGLWFQSLLANTDNYFKDDLKKTN